MDVAEAMTNKAVSVEERMKVLAEEVLAVTATDSDPREAIMKVLNQASELGYEEARKEHRLIEQATAEHYEQRQSGIILATVAALMRATKLNDLKIHVDAAADIWRTHRLDSWFDEETRLVHYKLSELPQEQ